MNYNGNVYKGVLDDEFCDGCCYNDNHNPSLECNRVKCCYLVKDDCILVDGVVMLKEHMSKLKK